MVFLYRIAWGWDMRIEYLREFLELVEWTNFSKAANHLNITQPTLSKHILEIERELKAPILVRESTGIKLTPVGHMLVAKATGIIDLYDSALRSAADIKKMSRIVIGGSCQSAQCYKILRSAIDNLKTKGRKAEIEYSEIQSMPHFKNLIDRKLDLEISVCNSTLKLPDDLICTPIYRSNWFAVTTNIELFKGGQMVSIKDFEQQPVYLFRGVETASQRECLQQVFQSAGVSPNYQTKYVQNLDEIRDFDLDKCTLIVGENFCYRNFSSSEYRILPFVEKEACFNYCVLTRNSENNKDVFLLTSELRALSKEYFNCLDLI